MLNNPLHNLQTAALIGAIAFVGLAPNPFDVDYLDLIREQVRVDAIAPSATLTPDTIRHAIGHAEGNLTAEGNPTPLMSGHSDPGNGVRNQGWCSDQGRGGGDIGRANQECDRYVFGFSDRAATLARGDQWLQLNLLDLWNQAGGGEYQDLPQLYRDHRGRGLDPVEAMSRARADSFIQSGRNTATGLTKLGYRGDGNGIALRPSHNWGRVYEDQKRRAIALHKIYTQH